MKYYLCLKTNFKLIHILFFFHLKYILWECVLCVSHSSHSLPADSENGRNLLNLCVKSILFVYYNSLGNLLNAASVEKEFRKIYPEKKIPGENPNSYVMRYINLKINANRTKRPSSYEFAYSRFFSIET